MFLLRLLGKLLYGEDYDELERRASKPRRRRRRR
mgnify:FL=1|jgi:hypothetical protein